MSLKKCILLCQNVHKKLNGLGVSWLFDTDLVVHSVVFMLTLDQNSTAGGQKTKTYFMGLSLQETHLR